jgi:hypothetical protein
MKRLIILLSLIIAGGSLFSQNPGYMGRHVLVNMDVTISPSWRNPNAVSEAMIASGISPSTAKYFGLNYFLSPNLEVIVWRKGTVGAGYNYYKSPFVLQRSSSGSLFSYNYDVSEKPMMTAHGFNVFYKQYLGSTMAPMGQYLKFTFDGFFYKYEVPASAMMEYMGYYDNYYAMSNPGVEQQEPTGNHQLFGFKVEYGYDYFVLNCLKLSMGVSLGTTFGGYKAIGRNSSALTITDFADNRLLNAYWFGVKVGLGFLTF